MRGIKRTLTVAVGIVTLTIGLTVTSSFSVEAADNTDLTQVINAATLTTDIRDASLVSVTNPTFALTPINYSFSCQTSTGTMGSSSQRIYVDNPDVADDGWTLTVAATDGTTAAWSNAGDTEEFDFNDPTTAGCGDGADSDSVAGQLTINANAGTLTTDCGSCSTTGITKGTSTAFSEGSTDSITLLSAASNSDDIGRWYLTGVGLSQTIPAEQLSDNYSINLTATVTSL